MLFYRMYLQAVTTISHHKFLQSRWIYMKKAPSNFDTHVRILDVLFSYMRPPRTPANNLIFCLVTPCIDKRKRS